MVQTRHRSKYCRRYYLKAVGVARDFLLFGKFYTKKCVARAAWLDQAPGKLVPRWLSLAESAFRLRKLGVHQGRSLSADPGRLEFSSFGGSCFRIHRILIHRKERNISGDFTFRFKNAFERQHPGFASDIADRKLDGS